MIKNKQFQCGIRGSGLPLISDKSYNTDGSSCPLGTSNFKVFIHLSKNGNFIGQFGISVRASSCPIETSNLTFTETHPRMGISPVSSVYPSEHSPTLSSVVTNYNVIVAEQTINTSNHLSSEIILAIYIIKICHFVCIIFFFICMRKQYVFI